MQSVRGKGLIPFRHQRGKLASGQEILQDSAWGAFKNTHHALHHTFGLAFITRCLGAKPREPAQADHAKPAAGWWVLKGMSPTQGMAHRDPMRRQGVVRLLYRACVARIKKGMWMTGQGGSQCLPKVRAQAPAMKERQADRHTDFSAATRASMCAGV